MFCTQCGAENPGNNRFCMRCGAEMATPAAAGAGGTEPPPNSYAGSSSPPPFQGAYSPAYTGARGMVWRPDQLVGFGRRFVAVIIDGIALGIAYGILAAIHLGALDTLASIGYFVYFWSTSGQTIGDMAMKIRVARADGRPLSIGTGIVRYVGYVISFFACLLGLLWVLWDPAKQGWHDKMAGTVVVHAQ